MIAAAVYEVLSGDATLTGMLTTYNSTPAIFTTDPAPGDAVKPYIVAATIPVQTPNDTKNSRGRVTWLDVRCYAPVSGSAKTINAIAERVRQLLHREPLILDEHIWILSECGGPVSADESEAYGRILTLRVMSEEI